MDFDFTYKVRKVMFDSQEDFLFRDSFTMPCFDIDSDRSTDFKYFEVYSESGFEVIFPELGTDLWEIVCRPVHDPFDIHLYIPDYYVWKEKCATEQNVIDVFGRKGAQEFYESLMSRIAHRYPVLKIDKMTASRNKDGSVYLECVIPEEVFGKPVNVCAPDLDKMDVALDEYRCKCRGPAAMIGKLGKEMSSYVMHAYERMIKESEDRQHPFYHSSYYEDENFEDSPEYFKWLFGALLDMAILGTTPMREFARNEIIILLFYESELADREIMDDIYADNCDGIEDDHPSEETAKNEFRNIINKAIQRKKKKEPGFNVEDMCFSTLNINYSSFTRQKNGSVGISREMLLRIAVGFELTRREIRRAFFLKGMKFPVFEHERIIDECIREGR